MRIPNNVLNFAKEQNLTDLVNMFVDYFNEYRSMNGKTNVSFDKNLTFAQKEAAINASIIEAANKMSGVTAFAGMSPEAMVSNPNYKWAVFAVIAAMVDAIIPDTIIDSVGMYTEVRTGGFGDNFLFEVKPRDLFVVTKGAKGKKHAWAQKQFTGNVTVTPEEHDVAVEVSLYRVLAGKESLAEFAMKAARSIETEVAKDCYTAFTTAMAALPYTATPDVDLRVAGFTQDTAVALAQKVTAYNNGAKATFVGTQVALSKILPTGTNNYRINVESDYVKVGYLRTFMGIDLIELTQFADWQNQYKTLLADNRIYVLSLSAGKFVKLCLEGSTLTFADGADTNANLTQKTTMKKFWGVGVAASAIAGMIELS